MPLTKSQINKLGDELRQLSPPDPIPEPALVRLQEFRSLYDAPLVEAQTLIKDRLGLDTTSRLKTVNTIVEKLRREKTRLAEMQDVAGLRIVVDGGLIEQDSLVEALINVFPSAKVIDRRSKPSHGYRAMPGAACLRLSGRSASEDAIAGSLGSGIRARSRPSSLKSSSALVASIEEIDRVIDEGDVSPTHQQIETLNGIREQIRVKLARFIEGTENLP